MRTVGGNDLGENTDAAGVVLNAIRHPVIMVDESGRITFANWEAESFFGASRSHLSRRKLDTYIPFGSPLLALIEHVRERRAPVNEYRVDVSSPKLGKDRLVDLYVAPVPDEPGSVVVLFQERSMADKIDRQLTHRAAARSVTGLAAMLAHEIKNPLAGIRGAAQLLETSVSDEDRSLTQLIRDETDRIVSLVDRMEIFPTSGRSIANRSTFMRCSIRLRRRPAPGLRATSRSRKATIRPCRRSSATGTNWCRCF